MIARVLEVAQAGLPETAGSRTSARAETGEGEEGARVVGVGAQAGVRVALELPGAVAEGMLGCRPASFSSLATGSL